nr:hypothetical protein 5 [Bacillaceae bacterium]
MGLQFGIKEVLNGTIVDYSTKKPIVYFDYATASSNENAAERLFLDGGQGNYRLMSFDHTKTSTFQLTLPMVDLKMLALLAGEDLATGASNVFKREELTITSGAATLASAPVDGTLFIFELTGLRDNGTEFTKVAATPAASQYTISGTTLGFNTADNNKKIVAFYQYTSATTAQKISIKANKFPKAVTIYGDGLWQDQETETTKAVKVNVFKAKAQPNFTLTMSSTDATSLELTFDLFAVKDANGNYSYIDYIIL